MNETFAKISHLRGSISLENCFQKMFRILPVFDHLFPGEKSL